jgi:integrase
MKSQYPTYKRFELQKKYNKLSKKDKEIIDDFLQACRVSAGDGKVDDIKRSVTQLLDVTGKSVGEVNLSVLRDFTILLKRSGKEPNTIHDILSHIKRFLKYHFTDWSQRFNNFSELKIPGIKLNEKKVNAKSLLSQEDINTILEKEKDLEKKLYFILLYEGGLRPKECRTLRWKDINLDFDKNGLTQIDLYMSKNQKSKTVFVKESTFFLKKMLPYQEGEYIFPSRENKGACITKNTATRWINELGVHIDKHIYPYLLRHTRSRELYKKAFEGKMSETVVSNFLGHSKSMMPTYSKLDVETIKNSMLQEVYTYAEMPQKEKDILLKQIEAMAQEREKDHKQLKALQEFVMKNLKPSKVKSNKEVQE